MPVYAPIKLNVIDQNTYSFSIGFEKLVRYLHKGNEIILKKKNVLAIKHDLR